MPHPRSGVIQGAMAASGAPALPTPTGLHTLSPGILCEENAMLPTHMDPVDVPCCMVGMAVSPGPLRWYWRESGLQHTADIGPCNLFTLPAGRVPEQWWRDPVSILTVQFAPEQIVSAIGHDASRSLSCLRPSPCQTDAIVSHLLWAIRASIASPVARSPLLLESLGVALAAAVSTTFGQVPYAALDPGKALDRLCLSRVTDFIEEHLDQTLHLGDLARVAHMSQFHFSRCFKRSTGKTVHQFVLERRIARARSLLAGTALPLPEVAVRVGLPSHGHFTTVFRQQVGSTPGQYRRSLRS